MSTVEQPRSRGRSPTSRPRPETYLEEIKYIQQTELAKEEAERSEAKGKGGVKWKGKGKAKLSGNEIMMRMEDQRAFGPRAGPSRPKSPRGETAARKSLDEHERVLQLFRGMREPVEREGKKGRWWDGRA